jgi:DEAD/DEAH box helicase domain-containing protein
MRFIERIKKSERFGSQVACHREIQAQPPQYGNLEKELPPVLKGVLKGMGIKRLYSHQSDAINLARSGQHIITATPTASGKSLIYNIPVFEAILEKDQTRAIYLFPLKALEQDQLKVIGDMDRLMGLGRVGAAVYDGDTSPYLRQKIRKNPPHIIISNPDMLHLSMLAYHDSWVELWRNLEFVVIDEVHTYRGVFGSHMAQVIRRLHRVMEYYGSRPTFILSSATVGNPEDLARSLTGLDCRAITKSGAPAAGKHFLFLNTAADSSPMAAARLLVGAIQDNLRTITFTQSRILTELIHRWSVQLSPLYRDKISSYRAGFLPDERRDIENKLHSGDILGVISTSALELGLDIGALDICILVGYPGSVITTWQRSGRVGRAGRESAIIMLAQPDALDQYFMNNPEMFFTREFEPAILDPDNEPITEAHLVCAASELPLFIHDKYFHLEEKQELLTDLCRKGLLLMDMAGENYHCARKHPQRNVELRGSGESFTILEERTGEVIGTIDGIRAFKECHPGAVYLHRGRTWVMSDLDISRKVTRGRLQQVKFYTRSLTEKQTEILEIFEVKPIINFLAKMGRLRVRERVTGFQKRLIRGQELIGTYPLDLPETVFETIGLWFEFESFVQAGLDMQHHYMGGIHAIEHAAIGLFPLFALCDRNDIGGISYPYHPELGKGAVFIYDGYPGGVGLTRSGFRVLEELLTQTLNTVKSCECDEGCPSCIYSPKCGAGNKPLDKASCIRVLEILLGKRPLTPQPHGTVEVKTHAMEEREDLKHRLVVFDLETKRSAEEVGGWSNIHLMGLAAGVVFDVSGNQYFEYEEHQVNDLVKQLSDADLIIGFNQMRFDYRVLTAYTTLNLKNKPNLDLLLEINKVLGRRVSLGHLGQMTLGREKIADGLQSLKWFKEGRMDLIMEYCREDVRLTWDLYCFAHENGYLLYRDKQKGALRIFLDLNLKRFLA